MGLRRLPISPANFGHWFLTPREDFSSSNAAALYFGDRPGIIRRSASTIQQVLRGIVDLSQQLHAYRRELRGCPAIISMLAGFKKEIHAAARGCGQNNRQASSHRQAFLQDDQEWIEES